MNLLSLPDIAAMVILMGVLERLRRQHRDARVDLWMLGLTFILLEAIAVAIFRGTPALSAIAHAIALDSYVLAAVTFGWASRKEIISGSPQLPLFLPAALPLFVLTSVYGFRAEASPRNFFLYLITGTLFFGTLLILLLNRARWQFRLQSLGVHWLLWAPMVPMAADREFRLLIYWGLGFLYLMVAISFRTRVRRGRIGGWAIVSGFVIWAFCLLAHPFLRNVPVYGELLSQVWTMQKFFVIIGMLLVLLEEQSSQLKEEALHDPLTGLPNRRLFDDRLQQALSRASRTGSRAALFVLDLDNFKHVNDTFGHPTGDVVLKRASEVLKSKIRAMDTLARCGGDEFNIVVNDLARPDDCERIAETLRSAIASVDLPPGFDEPLRGSVGYALYPDDANEAGALCKLADERMYEDKRARDLEPAGRY